MKGYYNCKFFLIMLVALLCLAPFSITMASEDEGAENVSAKGAIKVGITINDDDDSPLRASEYDSLTDKDVREAIGGELEVESGVIEFSAEGMYLETADQEYKASLGLGRVVDVDASYSRFYHRLDQDNLLHLRASSLASWQGATLAHSYEYAPGYGIDYADDRAYKTKDSKGNVEGPFTGTVGYTNDLVPEHEFGIARSELKSHTVIRLPMLPGVQIGLNQRLEKREGNKQVMGMTKCGSCHIVAHDKEIDEETNDISPYLKMNLGLFTIEYSYLYREFKNDGDPVVHIYDWASHPVKYDASMAGGLLYGAHGESAPLELARTPESTKEVHAIKAKYDLSSAGSFFAGYVNSKVTNTNVDEITGELNGGSHGELDVDYNAGMFNFTYLFTKRMLLSLNGRYQDIDGEEAEIDIRDVKGESLDWTRESDESRKIIDIGAKVRYRLTREMTLRGYYDYNSVDRDNAEYLIDDNTETHKIGADLSWRFMRGIRLKAGYSLTLIDDPYTVKESVWPADEGSDYVDKAPYKAPYGTYVYGKRKLNTSKAADTIHDMSLKANINAIKGVNLGLYARYKMMDNDDDIDYDYEDDILNTGIDVSFSPAENMLLTLGYNYYMRDTDAKFYIPFYHG